MGATWIASGGGRGRPRGVVWLLGGLVVGLCRLLGWARELEGRQCMGGMVMSCPVV